MRSIGVKNKNLIKKLALKAINDRKTPYGIVESFSGIDDEVMAKLPENMFDTWEGAYQEIVNIIEDTIMDY